MKLLMILCLVLLLLMPACEWTSQESIVIIFDQKPCFTGKCPVYSLVLHEDGRVGYAAGPYAPLSGLAPNEFVYRDDGSIAYPASGSRHVLFEGSTDPAFVKSLVTEAMEAGFFKMNPVASAGNPESSGVQFTIFYSNKTATLNHSVYYSEVAIPAELRELDAQLRHINQDVTFNEIPINRESCYDMYFYPVGDYLDDVEDCIRSNEDIHCEEVDFRGDICNIRLTQEEGRLYFTYDEGNMFNITQVDGRQTRNGTGHFELYRAEPPSAYGQDYEIALNGMHNDGWRSSCKIDIPSCTPETLRIPRDCDTLNAEKRDFCILSSAVGNEDSSSCDGIQLPLLRDQCVAQIASATRNGQLCESIYYSSIRRWCVASVFCDPSIKDVSLSDHNTSEVNITLVTVETEDIEPFACRELYLINQSDCNPSVPEEERWIRKVTTDRNGQFILVMNEIPRSIRTVFVDNSPLCIDGFQRLTFDRSKDNQSLGIRAPKTNYR